MHERLFLSKDCPASSMSARKDRARIIGVYKIPPHLSLEQFETKYKEMTDTLVALPGAAKNLVKYELSFSTNACDDPLQTMKLPSPQGTVVVISEAESHEKMMEWLNDPELHKALDAWRDELGFSVAESSWSFHAKVITKIDK
ncbi:hypothetical protein DFH07DRAFT_1063474 [Mycena maculata]|uniref:EthD domain-containing protein n=1 Tax=Mycena maculata TaxID=230809 RepID=A0AAD7IIG5_9AGAR|nr:hypothetical protein DFH07DRAFT_1063474 [Mycena maculata]